MKAIAKVFLIFMLLETVQNAKILGIFPAPVHSHYILTSALMNELAEKGHDVTVVTPFEQKNPPNNGTYRDIVLTGYYNQIQEYMNRKDVYKLAYIKYVLQFLIYYHWAILSDVVLNHKNFQKLIHSNETFDVVIVEQYGNEAHNGLANHFNAPLIIFSTMGASDRVNLLTGNPSPLSYIPEYYLSYSSDMTFYERLINTLSYISMQVFKYFVILPKQEQILKKYLPNSTDFYDIYYNTSLVLLNSHPSLNQPISLVPNMIEIGGFHIKPSKPLPKDLQQFLDSAEDGVIYFSMGSNLRSTQLLIEKHDAILNAFSKLKQKVLWKWEDDELSRKPDNVKIAKWLPQQDILAHPNVRLFITHGGLLSNMEAIYYGVPILAIPIISDQSTNAARAINNGYALKLEISDISEEKLLEKINKLLNNSKYREAAQFRSRIFHDQQVKPMDRAIYWVEYIARHGRADHLKVAGLIFPWYKYLLLDVIAFVILVILTFNILIFLIIKNICRRNKGKLKQN